MRSGARGIEFSQAFSDPRRPVENYSTPPSNPANIYSVLPLTDLAACDRVVGLYRRIVSRRRHINWQLDHQPRRITPAVRARALRDLGYLDDLARRLVLNSAIPHTAAISREINDLGSLDEHLDAVFGDLRIRRRVGTPDSDPVVRVALRRAAEHARRTRRAVFLWRGRQAMAAASNEGRYMVFDTLTVAPDSYHRVFCAGSTAWTRYIERWQRAVGASSGISVRRLAERNRVTGRRHHEYLAVIERGAAHGRLHIHVVHICEFLPPGVTDPAVRARHHRKIAVLRKLWPYGFSAPIAVRTGPSDAFGRLGWLWPETKAGCPARVGTWENLACYLTKYVSKSLLDQSKTPYEWRIRLSRGLGLAPLRGAVQTLPLRHLLRLALAMPPTARRRLNAPETVIPPSIIRREATRETVRRILHPTPPRPPPRPPPPNSPRRRPPPKPPKPNSRQSLRRRRILSAIPALKCRPSLVMRLRDLTPRRPSSNPRSFGSSATVRSLSMAIFELTTTFNVAYNPVRWCKIYGGQADN